MPTARITVKDLQSAISAFLAYENPSRVIRFTSSEEGGTLPWVHKDFVTQSKFSERLADLYILDHNFIQLEGEGLPERVKFLEHKVKFQEGLITNLQEQIQLLIGRVSDLEDFSGLTERNSTQQETPRLSSSSTP